MASCQTTQWVSTAPYVKLTVTQSASTETTATLSYTLQYITSYAASTNGVTRDYTIKIGSQSISGSYDINGVTGTKTVKSGTVTVSKATAAQSISFSVSFDFKLTWSGSYKGTLSASSSISVAAKTSYTVSYNANGGSGAPSAQTKLYGTTLTLSDTKPIRTGYAFQGWATSLSGNVTYAAGASYTANAAVTLYAVWKADTYTVSYNANGGSGAPSAQTKLYGTTLTLSDTKPIRTNYAFKGWSTSSSGNVTYAAGASYTANAAVTLYAVWELTYVSPKISRLSIVRYAKADDGTYSASDDGTYVQIQLNWECSNANPTIKIQHKLSTDTIWSTGVTSTKSGTSGTHQYIYGGSLSADSTYSFLVTLADSGGSTYATYTLSSKLVTLDLLKGGKGAAFGKVAELPNYLDIAFKTMLRDNVYLPNNKALYGQTTDGSSYNMIFLNDSNNTVIGYSGYANEVGNTQVYGNQVKLFSKNGVYAGSCRLATNAILWSGSYYMTASQEATLSANVTTQANGIVLAWSWYENGEAVDTSFNYTFIPKYHVTAHTGKGIAVYLTNNTGDSSATKYVYVSNSKITGHDNNTAAAYTANNGVIMSPRCFVLRYVIGV